MNRQMRLNARLGIGNSIYIKELHLGYMKVPFYQVFPQTENQRNSKQWLESNGWRLQNGQEN